MYSLINRDEIRRLEKAAKDKNKQHLYTWAKNYEDRLSELFRKEYEKLYHEEVNDSVQNLLLALAYTLYYSEEINIPKENIPDFISDLLSTIDMYRTGEYTPKEYKEDLEKIGVILDDYDYTKIYKEHTKRLNKLIEECINKLGNNSSGSNEV